MPVKPLLALLATLGCSAVLGATTPVSQLPLGQGVSPKPNVMFVLDDSNSMLSEYMPDEMYSTSAVGYYSSQCNGVAYNPKVTYLLPKKADGSEYLNATFKEAWVNGYNTSAGKTDLSNRFYYTYTGSTATKAAMSWSYSEWGGVTVDGFYDECMTQYASITDTDTKWKRHVVTADSTEAQNYANWYAYYRTRQLMTRTAAGRAMAGVSDSFRVGFTVISDSGAAETVTGSKFLDVADFAGGTGTTQRSRFFDLLYGVPTVGYTPLRDTISKVGRYYGKKVSGQSYDPIQYSCQRNYTLLSTDGYWNSDVKVVKLDGTAIGNEDGSEALPMRDALGAVASLADVAQYYYATDLRTEDSMPNNVFTTDKDRATHQHMNLFTLGLGVKGYLKPSDLAALTAGTLNWPVPSGTLAPTSPGYSTWGNATHVDDLWHAAVNGRGEYFAATDPTSLAAAITDTFRSIAEDSGTGAAAASSSQTPVSGDDWFFMPSYTTAHWSGDVRAYKYNVATDGTVTLPDTSGTPLWSAAQRLTAQGTARTIYFNGNGSLAAFNYANLGMAGLATPFDNRCSSATILLSQCSGTGAISTAAVAQATGSNLVDYLRGSRTLELSAASADNRVFRTRTQLLGDLVNAAPVYAGKPPFGYADAGYASYATAQASRTKVLYVAANDGMLHAFKVDTAANGGGTELWAYVPTAVIPELWRLADRNYANNHRYFVDATPVVADVYDATTSQWRTILVGGLGAGGRTYYALDVTNPTSPTLLWEFGQTAAVGSSFGRFVTDSNLGLSLGNPIITKNASGTWVVAFSSGVNNVSPGDGNGRLFVVNALTGAKVAELETKIGTAPAGDSSTPSNLMRINAWIANDSDNTALRFYGGDLRGNLWRFDPDNRVPPAGTEARLLGQARAADKTTIQPITTKPVLTEIRAGTGKVAVVAVGTGRFLDESDLSDATLQSIYAVKDSLTDLGDTGLGVLRSDEANLVKQTLGSNRRITTPASVDWTAKNGWYVDLDQSARERVVVDGLPLANGVLAFASSIPVTAMCTAGGTAYLYQFDLGLGTVLDGKGYDSLISGLGRITAPDLKVLVTLKKGPPETTTVSTLGGSPPLPAKRSSWRELVD
ncbi:pilus assembly protein [Sphaerotilus microaerophilus]|uniref:pilus assembly protein n=1 Tax=Sphaerotilus microaerophilus TaxID=2914710 RepID=UPI002072B142|nr:PilC/PilY family type IV pilus protein [Sphaerotilus sp. FB-5]